MGGQFLNNWSVNSIKTKKWQPAARDAPLCVPDPVPDSRLACPINCTSKAVDVNTTESKFQSCQQNNPTKTIKCQPAARDAPVCDPDPVPDSGLAHPVNSRSKAADGNTTES